MTISVRSSLGLASAFDALLVAATPAGTESGLCIIRTFVVGSVFVETVTILPLISNRFEDHYEFQCQQTVLLIGEPYGYRTFI